MTFRRKLSLSFAVILVLFGVNLAIYFWGSAERTRSVNTLSRALTRSSLIAGINQKLDDLHKQITILSGISVGAGAAAASPQEIHQFTAQLGGVGASIAELRALADDAAERSAVAAFAATFTQLAQSWTHYYQDFGTHADLAVIELALHADPLSDQLFQRGLPGLVQGEQTRVVQAKANFARASAITDRVSVGIFVLTLLIALGIAITVWRDVAGALGDLSRGAGAWGRGLLDHRMPARADEFGALGASFNRMAASLQAAQQEVREHAQQLEASNRQLERTNEQIERQKQVSDDLLRNILPATVAAELRDRGSVAPKYFEDVTILFTDFVGFTRASERLPVEELVRRLHFCFTRFDEIAVAYGLEKLKTIGDAYLCAGGIPVKNSSHPVDAVLAAFAMIEELARPRPELPAPWPVRIGLHTGPVAAGVVGIHKFAFDLWGDTVNFAARLEAASAPDRINISAATWSRVKDFFACEPRGRVETKEQQAYEMFFVVGLRADLRGDDAEAAFARRYQIYFSRQPPPLPACLRRVAAGEENKKTM
ncbi:MAG: adenylate/guanylate cyclase domain-containing protein [Terriglobales bacterium]